MKHKEWRKAFRNCASKYVPRNGLRCSHRPNGNPMCDEFLATRCTFSVCPRKEIGPRKKLEQTP